MNSQQQKIIDMWRKVHDAIFTNLSGSVGEEKLKDILYQPMKQAGKQGAKKIKGDADKAGETIMQIERYWNIQGRVIENSRRRFVREVSYCPWSYFNPISCKILGWYMEGFCEAINPNCRYQLEKLVPESENVCLWSITCKG